MADAVVSIQNLTRTFDSFVAVDHVTMEIFEGEVFGFLGPNGSGKTTTIRMLCGILDPSSGEGQVLGYDILRQSDTIKHHLGYMSQKFSLYTDLTVLENLEFYAGVFSIDKRKRASVISETAAMAGLEGREGQLVSNLSSAVKQRLALGSAILNKPKILFLDEPTGGIDPISRRNFWDVIYELSDRGTTIMVTTHYMDEAELCSRLAFIYNGKLIAQGTPEELKTSFFDRKILMLNCEDTDDAFSILKRSAGIHDVYFFSGVLHVLVSEVEQGKTLIKNILKDRGLALFHIEPIEPGLEDVFISLVEKSEGETILQKFHEGSNNK